MERDGYSFQIDFNSWISSSSSVAEPPSASAFTTETLPFLSRGFVTTMSPVVADDLEHRTVEKNADHDGSFNRFHPSAAELTAGHIKDNTFTADVQSDGGCCSRS